MLNEHINLYTPLSNLMALILYESRSKSATIALVLRTSGLWLLKEVTCRLSLKFGNGWFCLCHLLYGEKWLVPCILEWVSSVHPPNPTLCPGPQPRVISKSDNYWPRAIANLCCLSLRQLL